MSVFCLAACGGDKNNKATTPTTTVAATTAAAETTAAPSENKETAESAAAENGIPKEGDIYKGKKVGNVEKIPDCDDDKHGVIYIYDENDDLIDTIKY